MKPFAGVKPLRVCHIASGDLWAGAAVQVATILPALRSESGIHAEAILFNHGELESRIRHNGIRVTVFKEKGQSTASLAKWLLRHLRRTQPDVVHVHGYKEHVVGGYAARKAGVPAVVRTVHGAPEPFQGFAALKMWMYQGLERITFARYTDWTICVSQSLAIQYQRLGDQCRISVIPNAVSTFSRVLGMTRE